MQVGVVIRGTDSHGRSFEEETETVSISAHGALVKLAAKVTAGTMVVLKHGRTEEEQECQVIFLGTAHADKTEIGLEFTSRRPSFWRVTFPPEDWTPRHPDARAIGSRQDK
jgi:hypothetical protein